MRPSARRCFLLRCRGDSRRRHGLVDPISKVMYPTWGGIDNQDSNSNGKKPRKDAGAHGSKKTRTSKDQPKNFRLVRQPALFAAGFDPPRFSLFGCFPDDLLKRTLCIALERLHFGRAWVALLGRRRLTPFQSCFLNVLLVERVCQEPDDVVRALHETFKSLAVGLICLQVRADQAVVPAWAGFPAEKLRPPVRQLSRLPGA